MNIVILINGCVVAWCVSHKSRVWKKRGFFLGAIGEPFWLYTTWMTGTWGIFMLTLVYLMMNIRGYLNHKDETDEN